MNRSPLTAHPPSPQRLWRAGRSLSCSDGSRLTAHCSPSKSYCSPLTRRRLSGYGGRAAHCSLTRSFTLVELMVVLAVIVILASLLYPVILKARAKTLEKQAMGEVKSLEAALRAYRGVYGQWPGQINDTGDVTYVANNAPLIAALTTNNPRHIVFLQVQQKSISTNNGSMVDPWGVPYVVALDHDFNNETVINTGAQTITNAQNRVFSGLSMNFTLNDNVIVASWGSAPANNLSVDQNNYLESSLTIIASWQSGRKTK